MSKKSTYEEYLARVPKEVQEEFEKIRKKELLPQLHADFPFKQIYNPDTHADRVTKLFQLIFQVDEEVISSLEGETGKATLYSKKTIVDVLAKLTSDGIVDFEMQDVLQEFIVHRMNIYSSDMVMLQYSIKKGQKKEEISFEEIPHSYLVIFMKKSPKIFKESEAFIHVKEERTDTGIVLPKLSTLVYIELDKCLAYVRKHGYPEEKKELYEWLVMMADINAPEVEVIVKENEEKRVVVEELARMAQEKEVLMTMLADKYADIIRYSEKKQAKDLGMKEGLEEGLEQGMKQGKEIEKISLMRKKILKGIPVFEIADFMETDVSYVEKVMQLLGEHREATDEEIRRLIMLEKPLNNR